MNGFDFSCIIIFKMSRSVMSWGNLESSVDFNGNLFEWSNRLTARLREDSFSGGLQIAAEPLEDSFPPSLFAHENAINFADIAERGLHRPTTTPTRIINQTRDTEISKWAPTPALARKGLKHLASLLLRVILSEHCTSHREITAGVERLLSTNHEDSTRTRMQRLEEKNIKRRIYDALNVMISAQVLEKSVLPKQKSNQHLIFKNYSVSDNMQELGEECRAVYSRLTRKKELLAKLESQQKALRRWRDRKQSPRQDEGEQKLQFPLISLIRTKSSKVKLITEGDTLTIVHNNLEINSETDMLEEVYRTEVEEKEGKTAYKEEVQLVVA